MAHKHSHRVKADPVLTWEHVEGAKLPSWAAKAGITEADLSREIEGEIVHPIPLGHFLVHNERLGFTVVMNKQSLEDQYDPA